MDKQAEICETYQLKWNSYSSYIHSCIATSLHNESFTDVALVTVDGHQIMAHRFVLTYSSIFLAQILKYQPKSATALPMVIIMPPEIDYKTLKVLVRYMYSGEAKVSKEILNAVLRGGDILQVKGLYREKEDVDKNAKITQKMSNPSTSNSNTPPILPVPSSSRSSPVIITQKPATKTPQQTTTPVVIRPATATSTAPTEKPIPNQKFMVVQKPKEQHTYSNPRPKVLNFTLMQKYEKVKGPNENSSSKRVTILNKNMEQSSSTKEKNDRQIEQEEVTIKSESPTKDNLTYLVIKDEPIEWNEADMEVLDSKDVFDSMTVKSENTETNENDESNESLSNEEEMFSPLTCELCTETFTIPAEWVRHVQTHTDMLPAKRRRRDSPGDSYENDTFPELMCDMCQKSFPTPAEWVHHIQDTHTDFELHLSNKKNRQSKSPALAAIVAAGMGTELSKKCTECDKAFPSHASMVIHRRRHTGEKPYTCEFCNKNFNVKSNLLRHLRTLHNKIINSTDIENREAQSDNSN